MLTLLQALAWRLLGPAEDPPETDDEDDRQSPPSALGARHATVVAGGIVGAAIPWAATLGMWSDAGLKLLGVTSALLGVAFLSGTGCMIAVWQDRWRNAAVEGAVMALAAVGLWIAA